MLNESHVDNALSCLRQYVSLPNADLGLVNEQQLLKLAQFTALLQKWNRTYNLTALQHTAEIVTHHILDSLAIMPYIKPLFAEGATTRLLDVGSGGGFPGIPLALANADVEITLIDDSQKKTAFLRQACMQLNLTASVSVVTARVETFQPAHQFDLICCRAFASLSTFVQQTRHLLNAADENHADEGQADEGQADQGQAVCQVSPAARTGQAVPAAYWCAMKGQLPQQELDDLPEDVAVLGQYPISVPGIDAQRHLIIMAPK